MASKKKYYIGITIVALYVAFIWFFLDIVALETIPKYVQEKFSLSNDRLIYLKVFFGGLFALAILLFSAYLNKKARDGQGKNSYPTKQD